METTEVEVSTTVEDQNKTVDQGELEQLYRQETFSPVALIKYGAVSTTEFTEPFFAGLEPIKYTKTKVDIRKAEEILRIRASLPDKPEVTTLPLHPDQREKMTEVLPDSFKRVVKRFVDNHIISPKLAYWTGKIVRPSNVILGEEMDFGWSLPNKSIHTLPETKEDREIILIGDELIDSFNKELAAVLNATGNSPLSDEILTDITTQTIIAHEYGHKLLSVLGTLYANKDGTPKDDSEYNKKVQEIIQFAASVAPDEYIKKLLLSENPYIRSDIEQKIISERICVGLEQYTLSTLLREKGLSEDGTKEVLASRFGKKTMEWKFLEELNIAIQGAGLNFYDADMGLRQIRFEIKDEKLIKLLPNLDVSYFISRVTPTSFAVINEIEKKVGVPEVPLLRTSTNATS